MAVNSNLSQVQVFPANKISSSKKSLHMELLSCRPIAASKKEFWVKSESKEGNKILQVTVEWDQSKSMCGFSWICSRFWHESCCWGCPVGSIINDNCFEASLNVGCFAKPLTASNMFLNRNWYFPGFLSGQKAVDRIPHWHLRKAFVTGLNRRAAQSRGYKSACSLGTRLFFFQNYLFRIRECIQASFGHNCFSLRSLDLQMPAAGSRPLEATSWLAVQPSSP